MLDGHLLSQCIEWSFSDVSTFLSLLWFIPRVSVFASGLVEDFLEKQTNRHIDGKEIEKEKETESEREERERMNN